MHAIEITKHSKIWQIGLINRSPQHLGKNCVSHPGDMPKICETCRKFVRFSLKSGNLHDVACGEEVLAGCTGTVIGDRGYVSPTLRDSLAKKGIRLIAKHRQDMAPNSREEKRFLKKTVHH
jgi:hypothetical protein